MIAKIGMFIRFYLISLTLISGSLNAEITNEEIGPSFKDYLLENYNSKSYSPDFFIRSQNYISIYKRELQ